MEMTGSRTVPTDADTTWKALNDPEVLKACIPGWKASNPTAPNEYRVAMTARVGPVSAKLHGDASVLSDIVPPVSYTLSFDGRGALRDSPRVRRGCRWRPIPRERRGRLSTAKAQVGGKLAQIGSRLVDGAAAKVADDFFARFVAHLSTAQDADVAATPAAPVAAAPVPVVPSRNGMVRWISLAALVVAVLVFVWLRRA